MMNWAVIWGNQPDRPAPGLRNVISLVHPDYSPNRYFFSEQISI
jgi:hypothetical protein